MTCPARHPLGIPCRLPVHSGDHRNGELAWSQDRFPFNDRALVDHIERQLRARGCR